MFRCGLESDDSASAFGADSRRTCGPSVLPVLGGSAACASVTISPLARVWFGVGVCDWY